MRARDDYHAVHYFPNGVGHVEARAGQYLASFYGRRVAQATAGTVREARQALGRLARAERDAR